MSQDKPVLSRSEIEEAIRLAKEFCTAPDKRAQVKVELVAHGLPSLADMIDEAVTVSRAFLALSALERQGSGWISVDSYAEARARFAGEGVRVVHGETGFVFYVESHQMYALPVPKPQAQDAQTGEGG